MHRVRLVIRGRVQGVGFRYFVLRRAGELAIKGWVCNRPDGSVEVEAEGPRAVLATLLEAMKRGPQGARVQSVDESWAEAPPEYRDFEIRGG